MPDRSPDEGSLNKGVFAAHAESGCRRQLLLSLCVGDAVNGWQRDPREIDLRAPPDPESPDLLRRGQRYEQAVYRALEMADPTRVRANLEAGEVVPTPVDAAALGALIAEAGRGLVLLEHELPAPRVGFQDRVFGRADGQVPVLHAASAIRPDLIVLCAQTDPQFLPTPASTGRKRWRELLPDGRTRPVTDPARLALNLVDIKHTSADRVGRRHFAELLFYAHAVAVLLDAWELRDRLFVHVDGMGILPRRPRAALEGLTHPMALGASVIPLVWDDTRAQYTNTASAIRALRRAAPLRIDRVPQRLQPACARCRFFHDCTGSLGAHRPDPRDRDVALLPDISPSLAAQLHRVGLHTVGAVADGIETLELGSVPTPLVAARPVLALRARALVEDRAVFADEWSATDPEGRRLGRHLSTALPLHNDIALVLTAEADPTCGVVFAVGLHLEIIAEPMTRHGRLLARWWRLWTEGAAAIERAAALLERSPRRREALRPRLERFAELLAALDRAAGETATGLFDLTGADRGRVLRYQWSESCRGVERVHEAALARAVLTQLNLLLGLCHLCEELVVVPGPQGPSRPSMAGFYWSAETLKILGDLLDRHEGTLAVEPEDARRLRAVRAVLAPSEARLPRPAEKLYDIQAFVEGCAGLPGQIIHVTWHAIVHRLWERGDLGMRTPLDTAFWRPLRDAMAAEPWLACVDPLDAPSGDAPAGPGAGAVSREAARKSWCLLLIMRRMQERARRSRLLTRWSQPISTLDLIGDPLEVAGPPLNPLARLWALGARAGGASQKMSADEVRLSFPARGIGRLAAAAVPPPRLLPLARILSVESLGGRHVRARVRCMPGEELPTPTRKRRRRPPLCALPADGLRQRPDRLGAWPAAAPVRLEDGTVEQEIELVWGHPLLRGADPTAWSLVHRDAGLIEIHLSGMSANMNIRVGGWHLLVPQDLRDHAAIDAMRVTVRNVRWVGVAESPALVVRVRAEPQFYPARHAPPFFGLAKEAWEAPWYLYPHAADFWSGRLYASRGDNLLARDGLGRSWFGLRRALLSPGLTGALGDLIQRSGVPAPPPTAGRRELLLYAPELLPALPRRSEPVKILRHPSSDPSQVEAITAAIDAPLTCVIGPPGTGKSETIAALVDAFLARGPARVLICTFAYAALQQVLGRLRAGRTADGSPTAAALQPLIYLRSEQRPWIRPVEGLPDVIDLVVGTGRPQIGRPERDPDGTPRLVKSPLPPRKKLDDHLGERFVLLATPHQLFRLGQRRDGRPRWVRPDFGFDLIVIDEASQMPIDQLLPALSFVREGRLAVRCDPLPERPLDAMDETRRALADLRVEELPTGNGPLGDRATRLVLVGDHHQLPPVQPVRPPEALRTVLSSLFSYYVEGQPPQAALPRHQLRVNYRSHPDIVAFTRTLQARGERFYTDLEADQAARPRPPLPPVPPQISAPDLRALLDPDRVVGTLIHEREHETLLSPLEAAITARITAAFFEQAQLSSAAQERAFWREDIGVIAPHNAHGRLIRRRILQVLGPRSHLGLAGLMAALEGSVYTVEKFQGSARTLVIASMAVSAPDQLAVEARFLYDLCRFNVITSRARQKMLLLCSRNFLTWLPRDREVAGWAHRIREYALSFCDASALWANQVPDEHGGHEPIVEWRWRSS